MNFDPFPDWEKITEEHARHLHEAMREQNDARQLFFERPSPENAGRVIEAITRTSSYADFIIAEVWTVPVMVHVAGAKQEETNPADENQEGILQRCVRCKSVLHFWTHGMVAITSAGPKLFEPDDIDWWQEGDLVAKATSEDGSTMYLIEEGRELQKHEYECVGLPNME